jgi:Uncharacterized protein conserved in bacteria (DUF2334)
MGHEACHISGMKSIDQCQPTNWLPRGKTCAVCLTIDDVHPAKSSDLYEAGGDLDRGALRHVAWLTDRHADLKVTLFTTPDWRQTSPFPTRRVIAAIPYLRERLYLAPRWPEGTMRLDRHPDFVSFLKTMKNVEIGLHGLHHISRGPSIQTEFAKSTYTQCRTALARSMQIMETAGIAYVRGMTPPGWAAPPALLRAMADVGLTFVASACDIETPITPAATACRQGLQGVPLIFPCLLESGHLVQIPTNFRATSSVDRALAILDAGGLLSIKAHIIHRAVGHVALDALGAAYSAYLHDLFNRLSDRLGDRIWWTSMSQLAERVLADAPKRPSGAAG